MKKRIVYAALSGVILVLGLILFLLNYYSVTKIAIRWDLGLFLLTVLFGFGAMNFVAGILEKSPWYLVSSAILAAGGFVYAAAEWSRLPWYAIVVIALVILALFAVVSFLFLRWDRIKGKNEEPGYAAEAEAARAAKDEETRQKIEREKKIASGEDEEFRLKSFAPKNNASTSASGAGDSDKTNGKENE